MSRPTAAREERRMDLEFDFYQGYTDRRIPIAVLERRSTT